MEEDEGKDRIVFGTNGERMVEIKLPVLDKAGKNNMILLRRFKSINPNEHLDLNDKQIKFNLQNSVSTKAERNKLFEQCMNFDILSYISKDKKSSRMSNLYTQYSSNPYDKRSILISKFDKGADKKKNKVRFHFEDHSETFQVTIND